MNRRLFLLLGIALLVVATSWLALRQSKPERPQVATSQQPDYFIKDFNSVVTDPQGQPQQQLTAISLYHYPEDDRATLEQPDIIVTDENGGGWHATADSGELRGNVQRKLLLRDNVVLRQTGKESVTLRTEWLRVEAEHHYAETDAPVRIESPTGRIDGVGLNLYGDEERLLVRSAVRGQYEAN